MSWTVGGSIPGRSTFFFFTTAFRPALGSTQPPNQRVPVVLSPGVKRPGREADHSPPSSAEEKNAATIPPITHTASCCDIN
jgi:hypothetical protein